MPRRTSSGESLDLYVNKHNVQTLLASTAIESKYFDGEESLLEVTAFDEFKTCTYTTYDGKSFTATGTDRSYAKGSVGISTAFAKTDFSSIACYELGTLAPSYSPLPTSKPTHKPTEYLPSAKPSHAPTQSPSAAPSETPTTGPTPYPSPAPSGAPTFPPTVGPTPYPSATPSESPTVGPTPYPSAVPSAEPTHVPTTGPTPFPSAAPTATPTTVPAPEPTAVPVPEPTEVPVPAPTPRPSMAPTEAPSSLPTSAPSHPPSPAPTFVPTVGPTPYPSPVPTPSPTFYPTAAPSHKPSPEPTEDPTSVPTVGPTPYPSEAPTQAPTPAPTYRPSEAPSGLPTVFPSQKPTHVPIPDPTPFPTKHPTPHPTRVPTPWPSQAPSEVPTVSADPTHAPTMAPNNFTVGSNAKEGLSSADIGFTVMGILLFLACIVCCLAGVGFNSKRKKRERENALAWERVSAEFEDVNHLTAELIDGDGSTGPTTEQNPLAGRTQVTDFTGEEEPQGALFAAPKTFTAKSTTTVNSSAFGVSYQAAGDSRGSSEASARGPVRAVAANDGSDGVDADSFFQSMWPGSASGIDPTGKGKKGGEKGGEKGGAAAAEKPGSGAPLKGAQQYGAPLASRVGGGAGGDGDAKAKGASPLVSGGSLKGLAAAAQRAESQQDALESFKGATIYLDGGSDAMHADVAEIDGVNQNVHARRDEESEEEFHF